MVFSFIPINTAVLAADGDYNLRYNYIFNLTAFNSAFIDAYKSDELSYVVMDTAVKPAMNYGNIDKNVSAKWELFEYVTNNASARGTIYDNRLLLHGDYTEGSYIALKIAVPRAGWYKAHTIYDKGQYSGDVSVYFDKFTGDVESVMIPENRIGTFDCFRSSSPYENYRYEFGNLYIDEPGEYLLVYESEANENTVVYTSNRLFTYLKSFNMAFLQYSNDTAYYLFNNAAQGADATIYGLSDGYTNYDNIVPSLTDNWAYAGRSSNLTTDLNVTNKYIIVQDKKTWNYWAALKIQVPAAGSYDVKLESYQNDKTTLNFDVYVIPSTEDVTAAVESLSADALVGHVDGAVSPGKNVIDSPGSFIAPAPGDYIIVFKSTGQNPGYTTGAGNYYMYLVALELDGVTNYSPPEQTPENPDITSRESNITLFAASSPDGSTSVPVTIETNLEGYTQGSSKTYAAGSPVSVTAPESTGTGQRFRYWLHMDSRRILSTDTQVAFTLGTNTTLVAVYSDESRGVLVEFFDRNGKLISSGYYNQGDKIDYPEELPVSVGYGQATGWSSNPENVGANDLAIIAAYNAPEEVYQITVTNGTGSGSYKYNQKVTVTAPAEQGATVFSHWTRDGETVSFSPEYSFYAWDNASLTAHYTYEEPVIIPGIALDGTIKEIGEKKYFMTELFNLEDEEIIESGMLYGSEAPLDLDNYDSKVCAMSKSRQFTAWTSSPQYNVRAYVIYRDKEDRIRVAYSRTMQDS